MKKDRKNQIAVFLLGYCITVISSEAICSNNQQIKNNMNSHAIEFKGKGAYGEVRGDDEFVVKT